MGTCEHCGADAVDPRGQCRNCGWQNPVALYDDASDQPSLGETRAADIPAAPAAPPGAYPVSAPAGTRAGQAGAGGAEGRTRVGAAASTTAGGNRFCGACGARLEPGVVFCGQCGSPAAPVSRGNFGTMQAPASPAPISAGSYRVGEDASWTPADGNAPTEFVPEATANFGRSGLRAYGPVSQRPGGFGPPERPATAAPADSSRSVRLILGVLCLLASIITAVAAIILALTSVT